MAKQTTQFDPAKTIRLAELRDAADLTQQEVAELFYLKDRASVRAWEFGYSSPPAKHRSRFIVYLLDKLALRKDPQQFRTLWDDLMVNTWGWEPLIADEWLHYLPHVSMKQENASAFALTMPAAFLAPPRPAYPLVGRQAVLQQIQTQLLALTDTILCGLPGIGKTALAIELANDRSVLQYFRDGVLWARLGQAADVFTELGKWAVALGVDESELNKLTDVAARAEAVHQRIGLRRMLLVSDDVWQLEAALGLQVGGPNCARLITTRFPELAMQLSQEQAITIQELQEEDGLLLFQRLVGAQVAKRSATARKLIAAVGCLPLALILLGNYLRAASARDPNWQAEAVITQLLHSHQHFAVAEPQSPLRRHPSLKSGAKISLQAVIDLSYHALNPIEQIMLRALALFPAKPNTFSHEAARTVGAQPDNLLQALVASGLLESSQQRYTLHQTIADYLNQQPTDLPATERLVAYFINQLQPNPFDHTRTEAEWQNILQALNLAQAQGWAERFVQSVNLLYYFAEARGLYEIFIPFLQQATQFAQQVNDQAGLTTTLLNLSTFVIQRGELVSAEEILREMTSLVTQLQQPEFSVRHLRQLGRLAIRRRAYAEAEAYWQQALALAQKAGLNSAMGILYSNLGGVAREQGRYQEAQSYYQEGLIIARQHATPEETCGLLNNLANLMLHLDRYEEADLYLQEGLQIARRVGHRLLQCHLLELQGALAGLSEDHNFALSSFQAALVIAEELGDSSYIGNLHMQLASTALASGHLSEVEPHLHLALKRAEQTADQHRLSNLYNVWGKFQLEGQQWQKAEQSYHLALAAASRIGARPEEADARFGLAQALVAQGRVTQAIEQAEASLNILLPFDNNETHAVQDWLRQQAQINRN